MGGNALLVQQPSVSFLDLAVLVLTLAPPLGLVLVSPPSRLHPKAPRP